MDRDSMHGSFEMTINSFIFCDDYFDKLITGEYRYIVKYTYGYVITDIHFNPLILCVPFKFDNINTSYALTLLNNFLNIQKNNPILSFTADTAILQSLKESFTYRHLISFIHTNINERLYYLGLDYLYINIPQNETQHFFTIAKIYYGMTENPKFEQFIFSISFFWIYSKVLSGDITEEILITYQEFINVDDAKYFYKHFLAEHIIEIEC